MKRAETVKQRSKRILNQLRMKYPRANAFDVDGSGRHFACEAELTKNHPEYDLAINILSSQTMHTGEQAKTNVG